MRQKTFKGGVHPFGGKDYTKDCAITILEPSEELVFPMSQCLGAPAKPIVAKGERVLKGQLIAEAGGFISAPIFSSVSGMVKAIEKRRVVNGSLSDSIIIENDGLYETVETFGVERRLEDMAKEDIIAAIRDAGIIGLGGAGFPTVVKLTPKNAEDLDYLIINGAECEPYLTSDYRLMLEQPQGIIRGIQAILKILPKAKALIGIETNKPDAIAALEKYAADDARISVVPLKTKYPQGGERQLIYALTKRKINSKMLPADKGCVVDNVGTVFAVYEAVYRQMPLIHNILSVTGEGVNKPGNYDVPLGVSHAYLLEKAGGAKGDVVKYIAGGPMMGLAMSTLEVPVIKTSAAILAYLHDEVAEVPETPCIHCGRCVRACPEQLIPQMMGKAMKQQNIAQFETLGGMECIECGSCAFVCPAKIPLTQMFKLGRLQLRERNAKK